MKKKIVGSLLFLITLIAVAMPVPAEAQVTVSRNCCDGNGVIRCTLVNWTPVGNACLCFGQGWGYVC